MLRWAKSVNQWVIMVHLHRHSLWVYNKSCCCVQNTGKRQIHSAVCEKGKKREEKGVFWGGEEWQGGGRDRDRQRGRERELVKVKHSAHPAQKLLKQSELCLLTSLLHADLLPWLNSPRAPAEDPVLFFLSSSFLQLVLYQTEERHRGCCREVQ